MRTIAASYDGDAPAPALQQRSDPRSGSCTSGTQERMFVHVNLSLSSLGSSATLVDLPEDCVK